MTRHERGPGLTGASEQHESWVEGIRRHKASLLAVPLTSLAGQPQKPWASCQALFLAHALHPSLGLLIIVLKAAEKTEEMGNGSQTHGKGV